MGDLKRYLPSFTIARHLRLGSRMPTIFAAAGGISAALRNAQALDAGVYSNAFHSRRMRALGKHPGIPWTTAS